MSALLLPSYYQFVRVARSSRRSGDSVPPVVARIFCLDLALCYKQISPLVLANLLCSAHDGPPPPTRVIGVGGLVPTSLRTPCIHLLYCESAVPADLRICCNQFSPRRCRKCRSRNDSNGFYPNNEIENELDLSSINFCESLFPTIVDAAKPNAKLAFGESVELVGQSFERSRNHESAMSWPWQTQIQDTPVQAITVGDTPAVRDNSLTEESM